MDDRDQQTAAAQHFARTGFVLFHDLFDSSFIDELREEYERQFADIETNPPPDVMKVGSRRLQVAVKLEGPFLSARLYANPVVIEFAQAVLGHDFLIDSIACVSALPGASEQHLHRDHPDLFPEQPLSKLVLGSFGFTLVVPLVDLTPETGATKLFPRNRREGRNPDEPQIPYVKRGSAFAMDYGLYHQGTPNESARQRPMIYIIYTRSWFTDMVNYGDKPRINLAPEHFGAIADDDRHLFRRVIPATPPGAGYRQRPPTD